MNNVSLFIYLHCYGPVYANVTPKLGTAHVTVFQELVVYYGHTMSHLYRAGIEWHIAAEDDTPGIFWYTFLVTIAGFVSVACATH